MQKNIDTEKDELTIQLAKCNSSLKEEESKLRLLISQKENIENQIVEAEKIITERTINLERTQSKVQYLTSLIENLEDYAEGIKYLIKELGEKNISTVIDSIEVDDKFKVAIETTLGEVSNYLILNDSKDLSRFMDLLVENKKGKVTFILNDKMHYNNPYIEPEYSTPDFLRDRKVYGFANEFLNCSDSKHNLLMKYILDEYVIVEDMDTAIKYSNDNYYKFVTLSGDIVTESVVRAGSEVNEENIRIGRQKQIEQLTHEIKKRRGRFT